MPPTKVDINLAKKIAALMSKGVVSGLGEPKPGEMCVEAVVSYAMGEPHDDHPSCVSDDVAEYKIELNDEGNFDSDVDRGKKLRRIAIAQLGSRDIRTAQWEAALRKAIFARLPSLSVLLLKKADTSFYATFNHFAKLAKTSAGKKIVVNCLNEDEFEVDAALAFFLDTSDLHLSSDNISELFESVGRDGTKEAIAVGIDALRICKSPGIKFMDKLIAARVI